MSDRVMESNDREGDRHAPAISTPGSRWHGTCDDRYTWLMSTFVGWSGRRQQPDLIVVGVEAVDSQELGRETRLEADLDRHVALGLDLGDLLPFAVRQV